jgi:hypothetical protein
MEDDNLLRSISKTSAEMLFSSNSPFKMETFLSPQKVDRGSSPIIIEEEDDDSVSSLTGSQICIT